MERIEFVFNNCEAASACMSACDKFCRWGDVRQYGCVSRSVWVVLTEVAKENHPEEIMEKIFLTIHLFGGKKA